MRTLLVLLVSMLAAFPAAAQQNPEVYPEQALRAAGVEAQYAQGTTGLSLLLSPQIGGTVTVNTVVLEQRGVDLSATIQQNGLRNYARQVQVGAGITSTVLQNGNDNVYESELIGSDLLTEVVQNGDGNVYGLVFAGDEMEHTVAQIGVGNVAQQIVLRGQPVSIEQRGNGLGITVVRQ